jgi:hypothetical protein
MKELGSPAQVWMTTEKYVMLSYSPNITARIDGEFHMELYL